MSKLKRCPCCNKEVEIAKDELFGLYAIECKNCRILMYDRCKEDLIKKWNTRKPMEIIVERLEALRTCNDFGTCNHCQNRWCPMELLEADDVIKIVKEEGV